MTAKWSPARWGGKPKPEPIPDSAYKYFVRYKNGNIAVGKHLQIKRKYIYSYTGAMRYTDFMEAVYGMWRALDTIWPKDVGIYLECGGVKLVESIPYRDKRDWEFYRVRFNTPPELTSKVIKAIIEKKLGAPRHMFY